MKLNSLFVAYFMELLSAKKLPGQYHLRAGARAFGKTNNIVLENRHRSSEHKSLVEEFRYHGITMWNQVEITPTLIVRLKRDAEYSLLITNANYERSDTHGQGTEHCWLIDLEERSFKAPVKGLSDEAGFRELAQIVYDHLMHAPFSEEDLAKVRAQMVYKESRGYGPKKQ